MALRLAAAIVLVMETLVGGKLSEYCLNSEYSTHVMPSGTWEDVGLTDGEYRDSLVSFSHLRLTFP